jgi:2-polyprenyl-3-methyl-5-hydroxy-6-metoxy-1,4-benzoquinol methylase
MFTALLKKSVLYFDCSQHFLLFEKIMTSINLYGDTLIPAGKGHGADISAQRQDDLDGFALAYISEHSAKTRLIVADFGAGHGAQAARMAKAGAQKVVGIDMHDFSQEDNYKLNNVSFLQANLTSPTLFPQIESILGGGLDIAMSQRTLHYLTHTQAASFLDNLKANMNLNGKLFISASGLHSELGNDYPHRAGEIQTRFACLDNAMAQKHGIHAPVCLYKEIELVELCEKAGYRILKAYTSEFGNIKVVAEVI